LMELSTRQWKMDSKGRRAVEGKADYKKRGNRSPDNADALIMAFYNTMPGTFGDGYAPDDDNVDSAPVMSGLLNEQF
jgi:phage terminase large subunit